MKTAGTLPGTVCDWWQPLATHFDVTPYHCCYLCDVLSCVFLDYSVGFGGKYGVQTDRQDKSAKGWSEKAETELHASQTDHKKVDYTETR